jgi:hypothetical protein
MQRPVAVTTLDNRGAQKWNRMDQRHRVPNLEEMGEQQARHFLGFPTRWMPPSPGSTVEAPSSLLHDSCQTSFRRAWSLREPSSRRSSNTDPVAQQWVPQGGVVADLGTGSRMPDRDF